MTRGTTSKNTSVHALILKTQTSKLDLVEDKLLEKVNNEEGQASSYRNSSI